MPAEVGSQPAQPEEINNSQLQEAQPLHQSATIPKRKPVPLPAGEGSASTLKDVSITNSNEEGHQPDTDPEKILEIPIREPQPHANTNGIGARRSFVLPGLSLALLDRVRLGPLDKYLPQQKRKRRYTIAGLFAGLAVLLAIIIGLAAGLTMEKKTQNLPLPTANGGPYTGDLTYYAPGLGACGITSSSSDSICAVSHLVFDAAQTGSDPNTNPLCGLKIRLRRNDVSVDVTVVDRCVGCKATDIDTTTSVFGKLAEIAQGRVTVEWAWLETSPVNVTSVS